MYIKFWGKTSGSDILGQRLNYAPRLNIRKYQLEVTSFLALKTNSVTNGVFFFFFWRKTNYSKKNYNQFVIEIFDRFQLVFNQTDIGITIWIFYLFNEVKYSFLNIVI